MFKITTVHGVTEIVEQIDMYTIYIKTHTHTATTQTPRVSVHRSVKISYTPC